MNRHDSLSRDHHGPRAVLNAFERLANGYGSEMTRLRQDLSIAEGQLRDYQARLGKPFEHEQYLSELTTLRDQLKAGLSATAQAQDDEAGQAVAATADKIKAIKAAHSIETTPAPARSIPRIRRRKEVVPPVADAVIQPDPAAPGTGESLPPAPPENATGQTTHDVPAARRDGAATERRPGTHVVRLSDRP